MIEQNVTNAMNFIPADDRELCIKIGMALHSEYGEAAYPEWDGWLQTGDGYNQSDMKLVWKGLKPNGKVKIASLIYEAQKYGYTPEKTTISPGEKAQRAKEREARISKDAEEQAKKSASAGKSLQKIVDELLDTGEPAIKYLNNRGIDTDTLPEPVKFHPALKYYEAGKLQGSYPALVSKVTNAEGERITLHKIYLTEDGKKAEVSSPKKRHTSTGVDKTGSAIRLASNTGELGLAEGLETALACQVYGEMPVWACLDAGGLSRMTVPESVTTVYIFADKDRNKTGQRAANKLAQRLIKQGKTVYLLLPPLPIRENKKSMDWLDVANFINNASTGMDFRDYIEAAKPEMKKDDFLPEGYELSEKGVKLLRENDDGKIIKIAITMKPIKITALSKDEVNCNWGMLVQWKDLDNHLHEIAIPRRYLHSSPVELSQRLADGGLPIVPGKEKDLLRYLGAFNVSDKLIAATCTGWLGGTFVLPEKSINEPEGQRVVYQPSGLSNTAKAIRKQGTLEEWQEGMKEVSPMLMFFICASLSAPVRYKVGIEAGGFHAYNLTSQGKTTMLQAASSVWGNGVDPAIAGGAEAYIQRWNSTANALEAKAELFNDLPFVIDEIGEGDPKEFGKTIYRVISGTGRGRSGRDGGLANSKSWRVTVLSAGEIGVSDFIESGGGRVKGGQMVRMVDIDLASSPALFESAEDANAMKKLCASHYGHAGVKLLERVPGLDFGWELFKHAQIGEAVTPIASRVRARFALVAHAGYMAIAAGILPWREEQVLESVRSA